MVYAEKIVTMLDRGPVNTRWRDFGDVHMLSGRHSVRSAELRTSIEHVATYRTVTLSPVAEALRDFPVIAQPKWALWLRKQQMVDSLPVDFAVVLHDIATFVDPALAGQITEANWDPLLRAWRS